MAHAVEKITFSAPLEIKVELARVKDELGVSISSYLSNLIRKDKENRERERWIKACTFMQNEYENNDELKVWSEFEEDINSGN